MIKRNRKKIILAALLLSAIVLASLAYIRLNKSEFRDADTVTPNDTREAADDRKKKLNKDTSSTLETVPNPEPATKENIINTQRPDLSVEIKSLQQKNRRLHFAITGTAKPESGKCTLKLEKDSQQTIEKTVPITKKSCENEYLDLAGQTNGDWTATVMITSGSTVASDSKNITLR